MDGSKICVGVVLCNISSKVSKEFSGGEGEYDGEGGERHKDEEIIGIAEEQYNEYNERELLVQNRNNYIPSKSKYKSFDKFCEYISDYSYQHIHKQNHVSNFSKLKDDKTTKRPIKRAQLP